MLITYCDLCRDKHHLGAGTQCSVCTCDCCDAESKYMRRSTVEEERTWMAIEPPFDSPNRVARAVKAGLLPKGGSDE